VTGFEGLFGARKPLIGVVHVLPLPGSPEWSGSVGGAIARAVEDAVAYERAGFDAVIVENFGDAPFARGFAGRGAVAGLAAVGARVAERVRLPLGVNVLRNDAESAVAVAAAVGAAFIRVNVLVGAAATDQGVIQGAAHRTMRAVRSVAPSLLVFADVLVKHAKPLGETDPGRVASDTVERGRADALIVTGAATGTPAAADRVAAVRAGAHGVPVLVGSGVTAETVGAVLAACDGIIVGSAAMREGRAGGPVDADRAKAIVESARAGRRRC
jgi:membrane complex biogenesis BtpA family protein